MLTVEDDFLHRLARGLLIEQDEYDQIFEDLPAEALAQALAKRFEITGETRTLVEAARLYSRAGNLYDTLELCSRSPNLPELKRILHAALPQVQRDYPGTRLVGKLLEEAFIVIDLTNGKIVRFPPLMPATILSSE
jgi:hypothetical protein